MATTRNRPIHQYPTADQSRASNTTLADDGELAGLALRPSSKYAFTLHVRFTGTPGKVALQLPAGATARGIVSNDGTVSTSTDLTQTQADVADGVYMSGVITVDSTAGTLDVQWAQNASSGTATVRKADSLLTLTRLS